MSERHPLDVSIPDHHRDGRTLPQQIEGDHAYADRPPEPDPRFEPCDLCEEVAEEYGATVSFEQGASVRLRLCKGCRIDLEDRGRTEGET
jgi:hypothetical protein